MYDITIIGGGIVGLATALRIKEQKPALKVLLLEKENEVAKHQTGHNSGVIHSGLYYKPGSLKATNCIRGYRMLIDFCEREGVAYDLCGKIVVATTEEQRPLLRNLFERGNQNGLTQNRMISEGEMKEIEPHVKGLEGIWVPYTGIIDYKTVCEKYAESFRKLDGEVHFGEKVTDVKNRNTHSEVVTATGKVFETKLVVNCAGLYSDKVAQLTQPENINVRIIPFRGEYYKIRPEKHYLVKNLIYPVPDPNFPFLGVHFTRMIEGGIEAGPNAVFAFKREGYKKLDINVPEMLESLSWPGFQKVAMKYWRTGLGEYYRSFSKAAFTKALQGLIPEIQSDDLIPGGSGVRAQACDYDGGLLDDFSIIENKTAINVCNAPSPAATSSLSIGQTVSEKVLSRF
ncbi:L-2-hydroxyglutarate oxidase [Dyadobacter sp. BE34]|uniref:L-2-hydroxyglutarate oxidase n=1 Tax=Dyadobacter fermentans TaxID=94254 RepID=A0ABU1R318_9BACT|nr:MULTISPECIES: L-2-hydroxyglutarate oxidase [Dyadobacter]MDR6807780.1 L-2-hydroxyglutarate oxidase [Dyadobacter fermentans]MDR7045521.1 L-2-hydroxyglutarate oxidase [Dyadobacter sp. BE242]MDR7199834.1 L-2-hydroxyglutarate oxidase [Dyadobacter sp. BE34]MDR7217707.1 L-2-hydroxyglutarate oxidase [Dyadobacter sp. BE31]MDR7265725.1 L-2-hydroxyglutarate oxidase [Dyadobacter sp. BE32]